MLSLCMSEMWSGREKTKQSLQQHDDWIMTASAFLVAEGPGSSQAAELLGKLEHYLLQQSILKLFRVGRFAGPIFF